MAFAVNIMHGCGPRNKIHPPLQPKKIKHKALAIPTACTQLARQSALVLKKGVSVTQVAKCLKEDWFKVLRKQLQLKTTSYHP